MTALNTIIQGQVGYMMTDTAYYHESGAIAGFAPKMDWYPEIGFLIGQQGYDIAAALRGEIAHYSPRSVPHLLSNFADIMFSATCIAQQGWASEGPTGPDVQLHLLHFDRQRGRPMAYVIANKTTWTPPGYQPYSLQPIRQCLGPAVDPTSIFNRPLPTLTDPAAFDMRRDCVTLMDGQRRCPSHHLKQNPLNPRIGGSLILATVTASGCEREELHNWPNDRVGELIAA